MILTGEVSVARLEEGWWAGEVLWGDAIID